MANQRFEKAEHLKSALRIKHVMDNGYNTFAFPINAFSLTHNDETILPVKIAFVASKRRFKHAVDRNRIKRIMREAYRLQKAPLIELCREKAVSKDIVMIFIGKEMPDYKLVYKSMGKHIAALIHEISTTV